MIGQLQEHRETFGFAYIVVGAHDMQTFAPVMERNVAAKLIVRDYRQRQSDGHLPPGRPRAGLVIDGQLRRRWRIMSNN